MNSIIENKALNDIFNYSDDSVVRVIGNTNNPWFNGKDIATILGYVIARKAIRDHIDEEDKSSLNQLKQRGVQIRPLSNLQPHSVWINESGLYSLIFNSKLPTAKKFKRWVTSDVLPSIRKKGEYVYTERIKDLEHKIKVLENKRVLSHDPHIKLTDRLIEQHHYMSRAQYVYIYKSRQLNINNRIIKYHHPDFNAFKGFLLQLSKHISREMAKAGHKYSNITIKNRSNLYTEKMYIDYLDNIIEEYIQDKPLDCLDIDWKWKFDNDYDEYDEDAF